jgi:hypothetical protein
MNMTNAANFKAHDALTSVLEAVATGRLKQIRVTDDRLKDAGVSRKWLQDQCHAYGLFACPNGPRTYVVYRLAANG